MELRLCKAQDHSGKLGERIVRVLKFDQGAYFATAVCVDEQDLRIRTYNIAALQEMTLQEEIDYLRTRSKNT